MSLIHPFLPGFRHIFGPKKSSKKPAPALPSHCSGLEALLQRFFPSYFLSQNDEGPHSRKRFWTLRRTFWTFLFQVLHPGSSGQQAVHSAFWPDDDPEGEKPTESAYCQARKKLDPDTLRRVQEGVVLRVRQMASGLSDWKGWTLKALDGSSSSMPDTSSNQKAWPQPSGQAKGCGFPVMKWVGLFCLASGAALAMGCGSLHNHELRLFQQLWDYLKPKDLVVADRGFSSYAMYALFQLKGLAAVFRLHEGNTGRKPKNARGSRHKPKNSRKKKIQRLGRGDHLVEWRKPVQKPKWMDDLEWFQLPDCITVRMVIFTVKARHARAKRITLATTLLDPKEYPASELAALYARRWEVEVLIRNMKTTMKMDVLRCKSSKMCEKELVMHQIAYNLVVCLILECALIHWLDPLSLSYAGALSALQAFARGKPQSKRKQERIYRELLGTIAVQILPDRPGRKEPRAVKRRPKPHPLLTKPRKIYVETPHRSRYRKKNTTEKSRA